MEGVSTPIEETWSLHELYADEAAFERACEAFLAETLPAVERHRGGLGASPVALADALDALAEATRTLHRLHCYASLHSDEDTRLAARQARRQQVERLATELGRRAAWLRPEIVALGPEAVERALAAEPRLAPHAHALEDLLRLRDHVLAPAEERILAETELVRRGPSTLYHLLTNAELPRAEFVQAGGERVCLTSANFHRLRASCSREERLRLFPRYFEAYDAFRGTLGQNLHAAAKEHLFAARVRRFPSCLAAALAPHNVPESVYRGLIREVRERLPLLHRYFRMRARALGVERLEYPDLYGPIDAEPPRRYTAGEARDLVGEGLAPLGPTYGGALREAFASRWIHWHPAPGKRSGAYANGWAYDVHPYVLLNFNGDRESVLTLAHEMGHAMHSYFSNAAQPFPTADYPIFVAEVASTFNEALLLAHLLEGAPAAERARLLASYLDGIRSTLYRQVMFAEFELDVHERVERGEALTGESLSQRYLELLRDWHGHDEGVVRVGEGYAIEWAAIPHLYYDFYVYQYATGIVAATALACAVLAGEPGARERYLEFLRAGGSDYPLALLRRAGVDLETEAPYAEAFATIERRLDELETVLDAPRPA